MQGSGARSPRLQEKNRIIDQTIVEVIRDLDKHTIESCISKIGKSALEALEADFWVIWVWDNEEEIYPLATAGEDIEMERRLDSEEMHRFVQYLEKLQVPTFYPEYPFSLSRSFLSAPIELFEDCVGLVLLSRDAEFPFTEESLILLRPLTNLLGIAIPNIYDDKLVELAEICIRFLEEKDPYTHGHSIRVMRYSDIIARELKLPAFVRRELKICALLHDIGKVIIKDSILSKPGRLTEYEYKIMQMHPQIGANIAEKIGKNYAAKILSHHEHWNGKGYPQGLRGKQIPLISRIISLADTFDAMTTKRSYRNSLPVEKAIEEIRKNAGTQFDPHLVNVLLKAYKEGRFKILYV